MFVANLMDIDQIDFTPALNQATDIWATIKKNINFRAQGTPKTDIYNQIS